jgi:hypothetical protein
MNSNNTITHGLKFLNKSIQNIIAEIKRKAPFSKLMIFILLFIPAQTLSECIKDYLDKKKIFEIRKQNSKSSKKQESFDLTEKLLNFFNDSKNGK